LREEKQPMEQFDGGAAGNNAAFWYLTQPRVQALHRADIVGLTACGACIAGLFGRLVIRNG